MTADILIVDDEDDIRSLIEGILQDEGFSVRQAATSAQAYSRIKERAPSLVVLDIWLQGSEHDGMEILDWIVEHHPHVPVLMISGHGNIETAVSAIKRGAYDFIEKPFKTDRLLVMIARALETASLRRENERLKSKVDMVAEMIGDSPALSAFRQTLARVAQTNSRVLITGEPGTGKDIAARQIHKMSARASAPFLSLNCAILRPDHIEVELFGVEPGQAGLLAQANGGTLLLDEVADMPLETQGKIVRVLQEQRFIPIGGHSPVEVDVRVLASTSRDLPALIKDGLFREDLFYRLNVVPVELPPLRQRPQDIPALADYFVEQFTRQVALPVCRFSPAAIVAMQSYGWPGNVRQLRNIVEHMMILNAHDGTIQPEHLPADITGVARNTASGAEATISPEMASLALREARELFERDYLAAQIHRFSGNISKTAEFVGMERSALHRKLKQLGITAMPKQGGTLAEEEGLAEAAPPSKRKTA